LDLYRLDGDWLFSSQPFHSPAVILPHDPKKDERHPLQGGCLLVILKTGPFLEQILIALTWEGSLLIEAKKIPALIGREN
jgi:hypothetical protein